MKIAIIGAGNIGLYVGARLIEAGADVLFLGRERMKAYIDQHGLKVNSYIHSPYEVQHPKYITDYRQLGKIDFALISSKTTQTEEVLKDLAPHLSSNTKVINLQNGIDNKEVFAKYGLSDRLIEGMVMYNVVTNDAGEFFQSSSGPVIIDAIAGKELISLFENVKFEFTASQNIEGHKWSKLLLNLNNALNAIAGIPIKAEIEQRGYRLVLAKLMEEAIAVSEAKKIKLEKLTPVPTKILPKILRLPTVLFKVVAKKMVNIDPLAKSSMLMDMERNAPTEIDFLNSKIVENARATGLTAPVNAQIVKLIKEAEERKVGPPRISAEQLQKLI